MIEDVEICKIRSPPEPKHRYDTPDQLHDLAESIKNKGLLQPIIVRSKYDCYEIVAANRRLSACKLLGWNVGCHIVSLNDGEAYEVSLIENIQRKTLTALEEAEAFNKYVRNFGWGV